ncbi:hypothetical protein VNO80_06673 [Phaseolus coccineus]|uniref:Uncharacterized protein n=1 Tax=Phaseolus coccineus TaxID=3886 RepID=A0AAN9NM69_PHACN
MSASSQSGFKNRIMFSSLSHSSVLRELFASPPKSVGVKVREVTPAGGKVPKIVFEFSNLPEGESDRRKKLLNSIDKVEEQVLQQLQILKNTASTKEAERANRVRILMSMRLKLWAYLAMEIHISKGSLSYELNATHRLSSKLLFIILI